ncbi:MAG: hypothetical protein HOV68_29085 [Streptomycetaceae bacterium]|nr:hypothetical protein [Streptomycetaceae bacterium]
MTEIPYGVEVSFDPAIRTPGAEAKLRENHRSCRGSMLGCSWIFVLVTAGSIVSAVYVDGAFAVLAGICGLVAVVGLLMLRMDTTEYRKSRKVLAAYTWQEWPARRVPVDEADNDNTFASVDLRSADGRHTVRMTVSDAVDSLLDQHPDGDPLWFAGDARFGGVLAAAGGQGWMFLVVRREPGREHGSELADRTARETGLMPRDWQPQ